MVALLRYAIPIVWAVIIAAVSTHAAFAERQVALVVGNAEYEHADRLSSTINDASAIASLLTKAGFDVVDARRNVGVVEFKRAVRDFLDTASDADVAVVYYSGHGMEVEGVNYLIPIDAKLAKVWDADDEAVSLDRILLATEPAKKLRLIILDACRDNPFLRAQGRLPQTRSIASRLIGVSPTSGNTLIAYAARAGSLSYDGTGSNSPFTAALVKYIAQPGLDIKSPWAKYATTSWRALAISKSRSSTVRSAAAMFRWCLRQPSRLSRMCRQSTIRTFPPRPTMRRPSGLGRRRLGEHFWARTIPDITPSSRVRSWKSDPSQTSRNPTLSSPRRGRQPMSRRSQIKIASGMRRGLLSCGAIRRTSR